MDIHARALSAIDGRSVPGGLQRLDTISRVDGAADWALALPPARGDTWVVCIHGHGSHGDQLYTRPDLREKWLPDILRRGLGILTPNLRDNAWMCPAAATDLHDLLAAVRERFAAARFVFASGSMGGTSNLVYAVLHPADVAGVIARGTATDLSLYHEWCRRGDAGILREIADAIEEAYGGRPEQLPAVFAAHSAFRNATRLDMPVFVSHGSLDRTIPVAEARRLAGALAGKTDFVYVEVPDGNHDSPLHLDTSPSALDWVLAHAAR